MFTCELHVKSMALDAGADWPFTPPPVAGGLVATDDIYSSPGDMMAERAKLFRTGGSQAVRLPKKYRFDRQSEVLIRRDGDRVVLESARRAWSRRFIGLAGSAKEFPYPAEPPATEPPPDLY